MRLKTSKYNEIPFSEAKKHITSPSQIIKSEFRNGVRIGNILIDKLVYSLYSGDSVIIKNVVFPLAAGSEDYFDCEVTINEY